MVVGRRSWMQGKIQYLRLQIVCISLARVYFRAVLAGASRPMKKKLIAAITAFLGGF